MGLGAEGDLQLLPSELLEACVAPEVVGPLAVVPVARHGPGRALRHVVAARHLPPGTPRAASPAATATALAALARMLGLRLRLLRPVRGARRNQSPRKTPGNESD